MHETISFEHLTEKKKKCYFVALSETFVPRRNFAFLAIQKGTNENSDQSVHCANAQADINLHCAHMSEGTFSAIAAHMLSCRNKKNEYGKCPKISNTKVSDKMPYANSADPDQTAPFFYFSMKTYVEGTH